MALMDGHAVTVSPRERDDVILAAHPYARFPILGARDLCHLASCGRRNISAARTFDKALAAAIGTKKGL